MWPQLCVLPPLRVRRVSFCMAIVMWQYSVLQCDIKLSFALTRSSRDTCLEVTIVKFPSRIHIVCSALGLHHCPICRFNKGVMRWNASHSMNALRREANGLQGFGLPGEVHMPYTNEDACFQWCRIKTPTLALAFHCHSLCKQRPRRLDYMPGARVVEWEKVS